MKELLEYLVKKLVTKPKEVKITETEEDDKTVRLTFTVAPDDMGIIIGKGGKTIMALRSIMKVAGAKAGKKVFLELEEQTASKDNEDSKSSEVSKREK